MCECEGNTYNIGMGCCVPVVANADNYYTKSEVDEMITSGSCCITPEEVDDKISAATDGYATEQWVLDQNYISGVDLSDYALKSEIPTVPTEVSAFNNDAGYLTEHQSLSAYSTTEEVNEAITQATSGKADSTAVTQEISDAISVKADSSAVTEEISAAVSGKADSADIKVYTSGRGININTANTISLDIPIFSGSGYGSIVTCYDGNNGGNKANKYGDFSGGLGCIADGGLSIAYGTSAKTRSVNEIALGYSNISHGGSTTFTHSSGNTLFSIGNGYGNQAHNAFEIMQNGDIYYSNVNASGGTAYEKPMIKLQDKIDELERRIAELENR